MLRKSHGMREKLFRPILEPLARMEGIIARESLSGIAVADAVARTSLSNGGKRLRPAVFLLCAQLLRPGEGAVADGRAEIAAAIELMHTASLLHDDVVDSSDTRRGRPTANAAFGNSAGVLVGDFLWCAASRLIVGRAEQRLMEALLDAVRATTEGELLELSCQRGGPISESSALAIAEGKTAALFAAAGQAAAILAGAAEEDAGRLQRYGRATGMAFQLADDALDLIALPGAPEPGADLAAGICTYPAIAALQKASGDQAVAIRAALGASPPGPAAAREVAQLIRELGGIDAAFARAGGFAAEACRELSAFPESPERASLEAIARFAATRQL